MRITKKELLELIKGFPDEFSVGELFERITLFQKVKTGLYQSENDMIYTTPEVREQLKQWLL